jgi:ATP-dependent DNA helicase PIF1
MKFKYKLYNQNGRNNYYNQCDMYDSVYFLQGLTLDCVEMCLAKTFEAGQAYVALSRAKSLESLRVVGFNPKQVWANPEVLKFYRNLNSYVPEYIPLGKSNKSLKPK